MYWSMEVRILRRTPFSRIPGATLGSPMAPNSTASERLISSRSPSVSSSPVRRYLSAPISE